MAFTFVVETGAGLTNSNSYTAVTTATDYLETNINDSGFTGGTVDQQQKCLARATSLLDSLVLWRGTRANEDQALGWPRTGVVDNDGYTIDSDVIPTWLQNAVAEFARFLFSADRTADPDGQGIKMLKADVVAIEFDRYDRRTILPAVVAQMVSPYGSPRGQGMQIVGRA